MCTVGVYVVCVHCVSDVVQQAYSTSPSKCVHSVCTVCVCITMCTVGVNVLCVHCVPDVIQQAYSTAPSMCVH